MEWVEVLSELSGQPKWPGGFIQFPPSLKQDSRYENPPETTSVSRNSGQPFKWRDLPSIRDKLSRQTRLTNLAVIFFQKTSPPRIDDTIRYEWYAEGDSHRVTISFVTPENRKSNLRAPIGDFLRPYKTKLSTVKDRNEKTTQKNIIKKVINLNSCSIEPNTLTQTAQDGSRMKSSVITLTMVPNSDISYGLPSSSVPSSPSINKHHVSEFCIKVPVNKSNIRIFGKEDIAPSKMKSFDDNKLSKQTGLVKSKCLVTNSATLTPKNNNSVSGAMTFPHIIPKLSCPENEIKSSEQSEFPIDKESGLDNMEKYSKSIYLFPTSVELSDHSDHDSYDEVISELKLKQLNSVSQDVRMKNYLNRVFPDTSPSSLDSNYHSLEIPVVQTPEVSTKPRIVATIPAIKKNPLKSKLPISTRKLPSCSSVQIQTSKKSSSVKPISQYVPKDEIAQRKEQLEQVFKKRSQLTTKNVNTTTAKNPNLKHNAAITSSGKNKVPSKPKDHLTVKQRYPTKSIVGNKEIKYNNHKPMSPQSKNVSVPPNLTKKPLKSILKKPPRKVQEKKLEETSNKVSSLMKQEKKPKRNSRLTIHNLTSVSETGQIKRFPAIVSSHHARKEPSELLYSSCYSSEDDSPIRRELIASFSSEFTKSPIASPPNSPVDFESRIVEDDLSNICVKQLTASYLCSAEQPLNTSPTKRSLSPQRPKTPISHLVETYSISNNTSTPKSSVEGTYPSDFTPGVTLRSLKTAYEASANKSLSSSTPGSSCSAKSEVNVSFTQLREAYCTIASASTSEANSPTPRATTPLRPKNDKNIPETFKSMTRSCGDLTSAFQELEGRPCGPPRIKIYESDSLSHVSVKALTRSFTDLSRLENCAFKEKKSLNTNATAAPPSTIKVSVKRLRASYEDLRWSVPAGHVDQNKIDFKGSLNASTNLINSNYFSNNFMCANFSGTDLKQIGQAGGPNKSSHNGASAKHLKTSYQSKDELYEKHVGPRVRSFDTAKMKSKFNKPKEPTQVSSDCRICGKLVFQMEKIVAEKASWHKNCFRCTECNKNLTLETYQSHEGSLYCKPHFKELFRPKAVVQDEAEERKERLLRRPKMIVLESQPDILPDDVVRATSKPDYGLDELHQTLNVKQRFAVFENKSKAIDEPKLEPVSVRRSQSLMSKAARFTEGQEPFEDEEYDDEEEEEGEEEEFSEEDEDGNYVKSRKKKERPMSFNGMTDLKASWEQKQRREEMKEARKEDLSKFRQMLCAGKNIALKEMFESGTFENGDEDRPREEIKIEGGRRAASNLKARFEKGQPFILEDDEEQRESKFIGEIQEVEEVFKEAETAKNARNVFRQIDSKLSKESSGVLLRSPSFAASQNRENRLSLDRSASCAEVVKSCNQPEEEFSIDTTDLASRFKFFSTFEARKEEEERKEKKVFRITPPRDGIDQVEEPSLKANIKRCMAANCTVCRLRGLSCSDDSEILGRDPNLIKSTDNYQDEVDCKNTKNILQMFKKMEMGDDEDEEEEGPRPMKCFTPPPNGHCEDDEEEYSDEDYTEDEDEETEEDDEDEEGKPKMRDELLQMSARKAANLRAKFEKWEANQNDLNREKTEDELDECRPSLDTARNLKAMFEHKANEVTKPVASRPVIQKVNRFVGGGGDKCVACEKTVYAMEKLEIHAKILHKNCFRCHKCKNKLSMGSFSFGGEKMFCTTHYKQLFTEKGSYDALSSKPRWASKIEASEAIKNHD